MKKELKLLSINSMLEKSADPSLQTSSVPKKATQISIAEYMFKNIHLLGFENPSRVLNVAIRQLMDNALDAANQNKMLPTVEVKIENHGSKSYKLSFKDWGPGIDPKVVPNVCCRLLYGSKFTDNVPQRGQQGLGLTALILYSQKTVGKPVKIISKTESTKSTEFLMQINLKTNRPRVLRRRVMKDTESPYAEDQTGFYVQLILESSYMKKGSRATTSLLQQYCYLNPNLSLKFKGPQNTELNVERVSEEPSALGRGVKNVPHHLAIGELQTLIKKHPNRSISEVLYEELEGESTLIAKCLEQCYVPFKFKAGSLSYSKLEALLNNFKTTFEKSTPQEDCLVDLGAKIKKTVTKDGELKFDNVISVTSKPVYYEKGALKVEACAFYGSPQISKDQKITLYRVANGTPLIYQTSACCMYKCVIDFNWKATGLVQIENQLPRGNMILFIHVNSTKTPYITESKDAVADIPTIRDCINSCLQKLSKEIRTYMKKQDHYKALLQKKNIIDKVVPDLLDTLEKGLKRRVTGLDLDLLKSKILQMVCFFEAAEVLDQSKIVRCINGSKSYKKFQIASAGEPSRLVTLAPEQQMEVRLKGIPELTGITPVEYVYFKSPK